MLCFAASATQLNLVTTLCHTICQRIEQGNFNIMYLPNVLSHLKQAELTSRLDQHTPSTAMYKKTKKWLQERRMNSKSKDFTVFQSSPIYQQNTHSNCYLFIICKHLRHLKHHTDAHTYAHKITVSLAATRVYFVLDVYMHNPYAS